MAAPQTQTQKPDEVQEWIGRFSHAASNHQQYTAPAHANARTWTSAFFGCFDPIDTCLITCCCPCVTFGKTHHRLRVDPNLKDYSPINTSCIGWYFGSCFCLNWAFNLIQRHEINEKYGLKQDFPKDLLKACFCGCCDLIQQDKEAEYHLLNNTPVVQQPGMVKEGMVMQPQMQAAPAAAPATYPTQ